MLFLSYRREDTALVVQNLLYPRLRKAFPHEKLFLDIDSLPLGIRDFDKEIQSVLDRSGVVMVVIGSHWLSVVDRESGGRRIDNPDDYVHREVAAALARDDDSLSLIPLIVPPATFPKDEDLPMPLRGLARCNGMALRAGPDFDADFSRIVEAIRGHIAQLRERAATSAPAGQAPELQLPRAINVLLEQVEQAWRDGDALEMERRLARVESRGYTDHAEVAEWRANLDELLREHEVARRALPEVGDKTRKSAEQAAASVQVTPQATLNNEVWFNTFWRLNGNQREFLYEWVVDHDGRLTADDWEKTNGATFTSNITFKLREIVGRDTACEWWGIVDDSTRILDSPTMATLEQVLYAEAASVGEWSAATALLSPEQRGFLRQWVVDANGQLPSTQWRICNGGNHVSYVTWRLGQTVGTDRARGWWFKRSGVRKIAARHLTALTTMFAAQSKRDALRALSAQILSAGARLASQIQAVASNP